jgi:hypothetical protein
MSLIRLLVSGFLGTGMLLCSLNWVRRYSPEKYDTRTRGGEKWVGVTR